MAPNFEVGRVNIRRGLKAGKDGPQKQGRRPGDTGIIAQDQQGPTWKSFPLGEPLGLLWIVRIFQSTQHQTAWIKDLQFDEVTSSISREEMRNLSERLTYRMHE